MFSLFLFCIHVVFSLYLFGVSWFIQLVHYPIFLFLNYDAEHNPYIFQRKRAGVAMVFPMILELTSIILLTFIPFPNYLTILVLLILTIFIWISSLIIQLPIHNLLKKEKNEKAIKKLIFTNWFRTGLWSLKAIYIFFLLWNLLGDGLIVIS